jgi:hypothetical protein
VIEQAAYVVWRDGVVVPSRKANSSAGKGKKSRINTGKSNLPDGDPGDVIAHRLAHAVRPILDLFHAAADILGDAGGGFALNCFAMRRSNCSLRPRFGRLHPFQLDADAPEGQQDYPFGLTL